MIFFRSANVRSEESVSRQLYIESFSISETELRVGPLPSLSHSQISTPPSLSQVSMHTTSQLPDDLLKIKKRLGLPLVKFESPIFLSGFYQAHLLDSPSGFTDALAKHYKGVSLK